MYRKGQYFKLWSLHSWKFLLTSFILISYSLTFPQLHKHVFSTNNLHTFPVYTPNTVLNKNQSQEQWHGTYSLFDNSSSSTIHSFIHPFTSYHLSRSKSVEQKVKIAAQIQMESNTTATPQATTTDAFSYLSGSSHCSLEPGHRFPDCPNITDDQSSKERCHCLVAWYWLRAWIFSHRLPSIPTQLLPISCTFNNKLIFPPFNLLSILK